MLRRPVLLEAIYGFRLLSLNERQTSIFAAFVLCQPDSAGGGLTSSTQNHDASLLKFLQKKLNNVLQQVVFPNLPHFDTVTVPMFTQSLCSSFSDLKSINELHQQIAQRLSWHHSVNPRSRATTVGNFSQSSPIRSVAGKKQTFSPRGPRSASQPKPAIPKPQTNGLLASLAVAASREYASLNNNLENPNEMENCAQITESRSMFFEGHKSRIDIEGRLLM